EKSKTMYVYTINNSRLIGIEIKIIHINKTTKDNAIVLSIPMRFEILGANGERIANAIKCNVVIIPAVALLIPRSSRIKVISAPTDVIGTLKFEPTKITPISNKRFVLFVLSSINVPACLLIFLVLHHSNDSFF